MTIANTEAVITPTNAVTMATFMAVAATTTMAYPPPSPPMPIVMVS